MSRTLEGDASSCSSRSRTSCSWISVSRRWSASAFARAGAPAIPGARRSWATAELLDDILAELHIPATGAEAPATEDVVEARRQIGDVLERRRNDQPLAGDEVADAFDEARRVISYLVSGRVESDETGF